MSNLIPINFAEQAVLVLETKITCLQELNVRMDATINESQAECRRLKAEVERLESFCTRTILTNEILQAQVDAFTKPGDSLAFHFSCMKEKIFTAKEGQQP